MLAGWRCKAETPDFWAPEAKLRNERADDLKAHWRVLKSFERICAWARDLQRRVGKGERRITLLEKRVAELEQQTKQPPQASVIRFPFGRPKR